MIETHLNILDASVIGIMVLSCLFAFFRGLVREVLSLSAWIGAAFVTLYYFTEVAAKFKPHFKSDVVAGGVGALCLYIGALIGFSLLNMIILKFVKQGSEIGMLDNLLGLLFGALRGAFIVSLGFFMIKLALPENEYPDWLKQSITRPYGEKGAAILASVAPTYMRDLTTLEKRLSEKAASVNAGAAAPVVQGQGVTYGNQPGYNPTTTQQLDRLIDSTSQNSGQNQ